MQLNWNGEKKMLIWLLIHLLQPRQIHCVICRSTLGDDDRIGNFMFFRREFLSHFRRISWDVFDEPALEREEDLIFLWDVNNHVAKSRQRVDDESYVGNQLNFTGVDVRFGR